MSGCPSCTDIMLKCVIYTVQSHTDFPISLYYNVLNGVKIDEKSIRLTFNKNLLTELNCFVVPLVVV